MPARLQLQNANEIKILAFGDSLTEGYANFGISFHPYGLAMKSKLQELLPDLKIIVDIEGLSGDCVLSSLDGEFEERLSVAIDVPDNNYDLIIILGGTNDLGSLVHDGREGALEIFEDGLRKLYDYVLEQSVSSLLVMTVPMRAIDTSGLAGAREAREQLNELILKWVNEQKERVFSMDLAQLIPHVRDPEEEGGRLWSVDGLHMSELGYDRVGELLADLIHSLLKVEPTAS